MTIRPAGIADLDAIWGIEHEVFGSDIYPRFFFRQAHELWGELLRVAVLDSGELAGYVLGAVGAQLGKRGPLAAMRPEQRGRGLGARLTRDLLAVLAARGPTRCASRCTRRRGAIRLYERLGFHTLGRRRATMVMASRACSCA